MLKKMFGLVILMFLMSIALPALAQRYDSCNIRRGGGRGHVQRYDRGRDYGYRQDYNRRNRRANYGGYYGGSYGYAPAYYPQTYYAPSNYYVVRRPVRRVYSSYGYRPRYRSHRNRISFSIGF
jgi:hypothetical protein